MFLIVLFWIIINTPLTRSLIINEAEDLFAEAYQSKLTIGEVTGFVPFGLAFNSISLTLGDSSKVDTVLTGKRAFINLDLWKLWKLKVRIEAIDIEEAHLKLFPIAEGKSSLTEVFRARKKQIQESEIDSSKKFSLDIYAPSITLSNSSFSWENIDFGLSNVTIPSTGKLDSIQIQSFVEISDSLMFVDIINFSAKTSSFSPHQFAFKTQLVYDYTHLDINGFSLKTPNSSIELLLRLNKPEFKNSNLSDVLHHGFELTLLNSNLKMEEWNSLLSNQFFKRDNFRFKFIAGGNDQSISVKDLSIESNNTKLASSFTLNNWLNQQSLTYSIQLKKLELPVYELKPFVTDSVFRKLKYTYLIDLNGEIEGSNDVLKTRLNLIQNERHVLSLKSKVDLNNQFNKSFNAEINFSRFVPKTILMESPEVRLSGTIDVNGLLKGGNEIEFNTRADFKSIQTPLFELKRVKTKADYKNGLATIEFNTKLENAQISLNAELDVSEKIISYGVSGSFTDLNVNTFIKNNSPLRPHRLDGNLKINGKGLSLEDIQGSISLDINQAIIERDTIGNHQFYVDIDGPENPSRTFRFTSSIMDLVAIGDLSPQELSSWLEVNSNQIINQINSMYLLNTEPFVADNSVFLMKPKKVQVDISTKNSNILSTYLVGKPSIKSVATANLFLEIGSNSLLSTGLIEMDTLIYNDISFLKSKLDFTINSKDISRIKANTSIAIKAFGDSVQIENQKMKSLAFSLIQEKDSIFVDFTTNQVNNLDDLNVHLGINLLNDRADMSFNEVFVGKQNYRWSLNPNSRLIYTNSGVLEISNFEIINDDQVVILNGRLSEKETDEVLYSIENVDLGKLSANINLPYDFSGKINGLFKTKTLTTIPQFEGKLQIDSLELANRPVGNALITSRYDRVKDRFDAKVNVKLDSLSHPTYWNKNKRGNDFDIEGYVYRPDEALALSDTLYYFDINLKEADMWLLYYFIPEIYTKIEGKATSKGFFTGGLGWIDFSNEFILDDVLTVPKFLNTNYYMSGPITFGFHEGVLFDNIKIRDGKGGRGTINGLIDMDYWGDERSYDLLVNFNNLAFLNNDFSSEVPFYGQVSGSGAIKMTGPIYKPFLQTVYPAVVSSNSRLSVPLLDEQKVDSQNRFIEFVKNFDEAFKKNLILGSGSNQTNTPSTQSKIEAVDSSKIASGKSFTELFQMDLQFTAPSDTKFELVFDPVTGEVLTANGGGSLNITLEDQEIKMYGFFDVLGGDYYFVGGDLFTRKFILNDGGTLAWEGEPQNPRVNLTAVYRTRPNMLPISGQDIRVPVDLILKLSGSIEALQNDFYFEVPNTTFQDASMNTALRLLNSEDQKLPQATSLLLTGNFFAVNTTGEDGFANNLQNNATQAGLSQLLSNQINTLLNNSISNLDIDLNLNGFNQADLGIALRLFNDRLVLRREGQLVSNQTNTNQNLIGDLGASYKISRALSVEVFYRQDPTLGNFSAIQSQAQNVSGVGLQYQVEFNRWRDLPKIIWKNILDFFGFGSDKKEEDLATISQNN